MMPPLQSEPMYQKASPRMKRASPMYWFFRLSLTDEPLMFSMALFDCATTE